MPNPRVSVVIPTYNRAQQTLRALESVWSQSLSDYEVIVVDDGSTDDTVAELEKLGLRIRLIKQPNGGVSSARNRGIAESTGEFVAFLDSDDEWLPSKLATQIEFLEQQPDVGFIACLNTYDIEHGFTYSNSYTRDSHQSAQTQFVEFLTSPFPRNMSRFVVRRQLLVQHGGFDESIRGSEDWELCLRLLQYGHAFDFVEDGLVVYQPGEDSLSADPDIMIEGERLIRRRYLCQLKPIWKRWWLTSTFMAKAYFSASLGFRERCSRLKSITCLLRSLLANPIAPRTDRRLLTLVNLLVRPERSQSIR